MIKLYFTKNEIFTKFNILLYNSVCLDIINSTEHYLKNPMIDLKL